MTMDIEAIRRDISAFADDEASVLVDRDGALVFCRGGVEYFCRVTRDPNGSIFVEHEGITIPYWRFLTFSLAHLDVMAQKLLAKRHAPTPFVNGKARLDAVARQSMTGSALEMLEMECREVPPFSARVLFVTADAGHGKTILLREFQHRQAERFLAAASPFLFWHVDLQGRQLLRLSEALMGDLGELRVSGMWMPGIIALLRMGSLVLAIDGFDELAAEQGSADALGALALLVQEIGDHGTIVAASRRTFFDTDDYLKKSQMLHRTVSAQCEFDQLHLVSWTAAEGVDYLSRVEVESRQFASPKETYDSILTQLGNDHGHPILTRPFLLTHVARGLLRYNTDARKFIGVVESPLDAVSSVVNAFVRREVEEKWKSKDTGAPYLTFDQHLRFLAHIAEEMWTSQRDRLHIEVIELIASTLLDDWHIEAERRRQILDMVRMHVLLTIPPDGSGDTRSFDHPEFRDYFVAQALHQHLTDSLARGTSSGLSRFLSVSQLPESVARYASTLIGPSDVFESIERLRAMVGREWKPTFLQSNVGTIVPALLSRTDGNTHLLVDIKAIYASLVFATLSIRNVEFRHGQFVNTNFEKVTLSDVRFVECDFIEPVFQEESEFSHVEMVKCSINGVRITENGEETQREYAPFRVASVLGVLGINVSDGQTGVSHEERHGEMWELTHRLLRVLRRTTALTDHVLQQRFHGDVPRVRDEIIGRMVRHGILLPDTWRGRGIPQRRWVLKYSIEELLRADSTDRLTGPLVEFWSEIAAVDRLALAEG